MKSVFLILVGILDHCRFILVLNLVIFKSCMSLPFLLNTIFKTEKY